MSTIPLSSLPEFGHEREQHPRHIEIVSTRVQRSARPRIAYAVIAVAGIFAIFMGQLALSIALSDGAYKISELNTTQRDLGRDMGALREQYETLASPANLRSLAVDAGMVPAGYQAIMSLPDGKVFGTPVAASANGEKAGKDSVANAIAPKETAAASGNITENGEADVAATPATSTTTGDAEASGAPDAADGATPITSNAGALPSPVTH